MTKKESQALHNLLEVKEYREKADKCFERIRHIAERNNVCIGKNEQYIYAATFIEIYERCETADAKYDFVWAYTNWKEAVEIADTYYRLADRASREFGIAIASY